MPYIEYAAFDFRKPGRVAQLVAYLTRDLEVTGSIPGCGDILSGDFSIASHL